MSVTILSGGQTGVDRGALDGALRAKTPCGGWCPRGRRAEDGPIPAHYPLRETLSHTYPERTRKNIEEADATLIINRGRLTGGTALTCRLARQMGKPCLVVDPGYGVEKSAKLIATWMQSAGVSILNVAGPKESKQPGIHALTVQIVERALARLEELTRQVA